MHATHDGKSFFRGDRRGYRRERAAAPNARQREREREREKERGSRSLSSGCSRLSGSGVTYKSSEKKRGAYRRDCGSTCETCLALRSMRAGDVRLKGEGGG